jgi:hypothetical protein
MFADSQEEVFKLLVQDLIIDRDRVARFRDNAELAVLIGLSPERLSKGMANDFWTVIHPFLASVVKILKNVEFERPLRSVYGRNTSLS